MSDENMGTVATQAAPSVEAVEEATGGRSSKAMLVVGAVAVVVLAVFAYVLFGTGGSSTPEDLGPVPKAEAPAAPAAPAKNTDKGKSDDKSTTKTADDEGRNPFEPLEAQTTSTGTDAPAAEDPGTAPTTPVGETVTVSLVAVGSSHVTAKVDSTTYKKVAEGETFGTNFQVYAIFNDSCAGFLYGDDSFALCEGKSVELSKL